MQTDTHPSSHRPPRDSDARGPFSWRHWIAIGIALAALLTCLAAWFQPQILVPSYLAATLWVWSLSAGAIALLLIGHLTGGRWTNKLRPYSETAARLMPLVTLAFIPLAWQLDRLYPWITPDFFAGKENAAHKQLYLSKEFFLVRSVLYLAIFNGIGYLVAGRLGTRVKTGLLPGGQATAGLCSVALLLTITWCSMDWLMSINPDFTSTIFGVLVGFGALLGSLAWCIAWRLLASRLWPTSAVVQDSPSAETSAADNDLGNLLLAVLMLWAYAHLGQFLLMWSGNLPAEAQFYLPRMEGVGKTLSLTLIIASFVIPQLALMSRRVRTSSLVMVFLSGWLVLMQLIHFAWLLAAKLTLDSTLGLILSLLTPLVFLSAISWIAAWETERMFRTSQEAGSYA